eukprot:TRINITY_DN2045_c0_g1_i2.p1 TRINITY_DN2045_c0_g1~~TRINITY_DN2045_c0_g1_i2.p1  ORF type:complete len:248 (-),score=122.91 TRINITY_DN2045_c0_g1_i2:22-699(-)
MADDNPELDLLGDSQPEEPVVAEAPAVVEEPKVEEPKVEEEKKEEVEVASPPKAAAAAPAEAPKAAAAKPADDDDDDLHKTPTKTKPKKPSASTEPKKSTVSRSPAKSPMSKTPTRVAASPASGVPLHPECTFKPAISPVAHKAPRAGGRSVYDSLYDDAVTRVEKLKLKKAEKDKALDSLDMSPKVSDLAKSKIKGRDVYDTLYSDAIEREKRLKQKREEFLRK